MWSAENDEQAKNSTQYPTPQSMAILLVQSQKAFAQHAGNHSTLLLTLQCYCEVSTFLPNTFHAEFEPQESMAYLGKCCVSICAAQGPMMLRP